jgi:hypothetical protein
LQASRFWTIRDVCNPIVIRHSQGLRAKQQQAG